MRLPEPRSSADQSSGRETITCERLVLPERDAWTVVHARLLTSTHQSPYRSPRKRLLLQSAFGPHPWETFSLPAHYHDGTGSVVDHRIGDAAQQCPLQRSETATPHDYQP